MSDTSSPTAPDDGDQTVSGPAPTLSSSSDTPLLAVVGIGGSAGALDGYERFFLGLAGGGQMAFVVVAHQDPAHQGVMPELLQRCTGLSVTEVTGETRLRPDRVYVAPPGQDLSVSGGVLILSPASPEGPLPIDRFFESLAHDLGPRAVAVVLSGSGQDGSQGVRAIRARGGLVMVQEPSSAEYPSMPSSAIATQTAQHVLPAEELATRLHAVVTRRPATALEAYFPDDLTADHDSPGGEQPSPFLQTILLLIRAQTGHDFTGYKHSTLVRRINRRMQTQSLSNLGQYARFLRETPGEVTALYKDLTINVTSFFRDPDAFASLREQLRHTLSERGEQDSESSAYRVWAPGCSTGEEAYSLAITLNEVLTELGEQRNVKVQIFATDIDEDSVATARAGVYPGRVSYMVSPERLARYFTAREDAYQIKPEIRDMVVFAIHNTFGDPPFTRLDLLCCRNMLIYLGSELQRQLIPLFHYALKPGGLLFLGPSETTGAARELFPTLDSQWKIFRRGEGPAQPVALNYGSHVTRTATVSRSEPAAPFRARREAEVSQLVNTVLLAEYTPPSVVVTPKGEIVHVVGRTGPYLELALGKVGTNVLEMARDGLRYELSAMLRQAAGEHREVSVRGLRVRIDGEYQAVDVLVRPLNRPDTEQSLLLIVFEQGPGPASPEAAQRGAGRTPEGTPAPDRAEASTENHAAVLREMERELKYSREYLQANLEEMEVSLEQLKSTNEELQTTNEELQSTNEELMTSKEELQSLNEELITINTEHQIIITDLAQANDDMKNLLDSAGIATVFLGNDLRIKRFTPRITGVIHLIPSDVGRPIMHIVTNLRHESLEADVTEVLRTLTPLETEVETKDGQWFLMKIAPYRTFDNFIDGVVIVFTSITAIKRLERQLQVSTLYADEAINAFPDPFLVLDTELKLVSANRAFYSLLRLTPAQAVGQPLSGLGGGQKNFQPLEGVLRRVALGEGSLTDHAADFDVPFLGRRVMKFTARHLLSTDGRSQLVLLTLEDMTDLLGQVEREGVENLVAQKESETPAEQLSDDSGQRDQGEV